MLGYFVVGTLAAFGTLCACWVLLGWFLPAGEGSALVCWGSPDERILWRFQWLRETGLLHLPLLIVAEEMENTYPGTEIISREQLLSRLEQERNRFNGTGNGDLTGHNQCRGISEL